MALQLIASLSISSTPTRLPFSSTSSAGYIGGNNLSLGCTVRCMGAAKANDQPVVRRSATFKYHGWDNDFVQSISSEYVGEQHTAQHNKLKKQVRLMLEKASKPLDQLELIDILERLGIDYQFENEIDGILKTILIDGDYPAYLETKGDLYATSLQFRILRQHGYKVPQEVFNQFRDENGKLKAHLCNDLKGMLYLYEASFFSMEAESILDDARDYTTTYLTKYVNECRSNNTGYLERLVTHALEIPLAWRVPRILASWFINLYESKHDMEPILLELAKLDFNMLQALHQDDLKDTYRWWENTSFGEKLKFGRNWVRECFFWAAAALGVEPQFGYCRRVTAKLDLFVTLMDDIYDIYGTLDELELFTDAIARWDLNAVDQLPDYLKIFFLCLYNTINEMAYDILKDQGVYIISYLQKTWADYCESYLLEAKWYNNGYTPTLQEYLKNAETSISMEMLLVHTFCCVTNPLTREALESLKEYADMIRCTGVIVRLANDLGTSTGEMRRGDVPKAIQCHMHETGCSEEEAREHITHLMSETWKKLNGYRYANPHLSKRFIKVIANLSRTGIALFPNRIDYDDLIPKYEKIATSLFIEPIC